MTTIVVKAQSGKYLFEDEIAPSLSLISGKAYTFYVSDSSLPAHPLNFKLVGVPRGEGVVFAKALDDSVVHIVSVIVPSASVGTLSYYCVNHSGMVHDFLIVSNEILGIGEGDTLIGSAGDDTIVGGTLDNTLNGDKGDDTLKVVLALTALSFTPTLGSIPSQTMKQTKTYWNSMMQTTLC